MATSLAAPCSMDSCASSRLSSVLECAGRSVPRWERDKVRGLYGNPGPESRPRAGAGSPSPEKPQGFLSPHLEKHPEIGAWRGAALLLPLDRGKDFNRPLSPLLWLREDATGISRCPCPRDRAGKPRSLREGCRGEPVPRFPLVNPGGRGHDGDPPPTRGFPGEDALGGARTTGQPGLSGSKASGEPNPPGTACVRSSPLPQPRRPHSRARERHQGPAGPISSGTPHPTGGRATGARRPRTARNRPPRGAGMGHPRGPGPGPRRPRYLPPPGAGPRRKQTPPRNRFRPRAQPRRYL
ncbi:collagen alpha-1(I) chain-like [Harpia harpyja]|uniref:collagen alpha-1(I) chain-like n=1 Tax=Harpia harpyja TaxID=202280 RepID=UPI0022B216B1|nr:collagen alpha-1(I) chain-like [Harpia harpyja]